MHMINFGVTSQLNVLPTIYTMPKKSLNFWEGLSSPSVKQDHLNTTIQPLTVQSVQFSSFWFDNPGMLHLQYRGGFHAGPGPHYSGGWWWHHHWTRLSYRKWRCSNLFFWKGKGQIPFFKAHHPSTEKPKALVGFEPRTELVEGDLNS